VLCDILNICESDSTKMRLYEKFEYNTRGVAGFLRQGEVNPMISKFQKQGGRNVFVHIDRAAIHP
jgi:hypothetical protein